VNEERIYITRVTINNFGGITHFEAKLGQVALISGRNGSGKSSVLDALRTIFDGGSDPSQIRHGCEWADIEIEFSTGHKAIKSIWPTRYELVVSSPEGGIIRAGKTWLDSLTPALSFDPIGFLNAEPKKRADWLLSKMPLVFTAEEVEAATKQPGIVRGTCGLEKINEIRTGRYEQRTTVNRRSEELTGAIQTMRRALPIEEVSVDWSALRDQLATRHSEISGEIEAAALKVDAEAQKEKTGKRQEITAKIAELQAELAAYLAEVDTEAAKVIANATRELEAERATVSEELGQARANADAAMRVKGQLQAIDESSQIQKGYVMEAFNLTTQIEALDALKHQKLKEVPIAGFDMKFEGRKPVITIEGVPLDRLNRQQQLYVAMQAVTQASGKLPLVLCECAELDDAHMDELAGAMKEQGLQLIVARWDNDGPLAVKAA
jgi:energy-coupling factor transporter ATP-binding protein EcfA2